MRFLRDPRCARWLLPGLLALLAILLGLNIVNQFAGGWLPGGLVAQTELAGKANFAAGLAASIGVGAGLIGWWRAARSRSWERLRWGLIGTGCVAYALADLLLDHPAGLLLLALTLLAGLCFLLLHHHLRASRSALALLWLVAGIAVANPVVERYEIRLAGSPVNYRYLSPHEPYQMTASAWQRLALAREAQEASELLLLMVVLKLVLIDAGGKTPAPVPMEPVQGCGANER